MPNKPEQARVLTAFRRDFVFNRTSQFAHALFFRGHIDVTVCPQQDYQRLLSSQPGRRLNPAKLAESSVLKNKLVDLIAFLENLAVKDSAEKDLFFKRLPQALPGVPLPVQRMKLLPLLSQALTFGGAPAVALGSILQVCVFLISVHLYASQSCCLSC